MNLSFEFQEINNITISYRTKTFFFLFRLVLEPLKINLVPFVSLNYPCIFFINRYKIIAKKLLRVMSMLKESTPEERRFKLNDSKITKCKLGLIQ